MANQDVKAHIEAFDDLELVGCIETILESPEYEKGDFTKMVKDIARKYRIYDCITFKQRQVLERHCEVNSKLWY